MLSVNYAKWHKLGLYDECHNAEYLSAVMLSVVIVITLNAVMLSVVIVITLSVVMLSLVAPLGHSGACPSVLPSGTSKGRLQAIAASN